MASALEPASPLGTYKSINPIITGIGSSQECQVSLEAGQAIAIIGYGYITVKTGEVECFGARIDASHGKISFFSPECYSLLVFSAPTTSSGSISLCEGNSRWRQLTSFLNMKDVWGDGVFLSTLKSKSLEIYSIFEGLHLISLSEGSINMGFSYLSPIPLWKDLSNYLTPLTSLSLIVFGSKGSGKSTLLKYSINSYLSQHRVGTSSSPSGALFLNLDCGQSEFGPPAIVSLFHIDSFILGPSFATQYRPIHQEYVGVISIADNPRGYLHAVEKLCNFLHGQAPRGLPVFVNTMGWTSGLGLEMFRSIVQLVRPSTIVPLIENVTTAEDLSSSILVREAVQRLSSTLYEPLQFRVHSSLSSKLISPTILPTSATLITTGSPISKYSPKELRSLTLLSYFNISRDTFSPIFCMNPLSVPFSRLQIESSRAPSFNCTMVGLFDGSAFLGLGFIRAVDMEHELFHLVVPDIFVEIVIQRLNAISRSKLNVHPREYYDSFTKSAPTLFNDNITIQGGSVRKARHTILRKRPV